MKEKEKISVMEFARRIGISKYTAWLWLKRGLIPLEKVKIGRQTWLFWDEKKVAQKMTALGDDKIKIDLIRVRALVDRILSKLISPDLAMAKRLISKK